MDIRFPVAYSEVDIAHSLDFEADTLCPAVYSAVGIQHSLDFAADSPCFPSSDAAAHTFLAPRIPPTVHRPSADAASSVNPGLYTRFAAADFQSESYMSLDPEVGSVMGLDRSHDSSNVVPVNRC